MYQERKPKVPSKIFKHAVMDCTPFIKAGTRVWVVRPLVSSRPYESVIDCHYQEHVMSRLERVPICRLNIAMMQDKYRAPFIMIKSR